MTAERIALIVGINHYENIRSLFGCAGDARKLEKVLARHENGGKNFDCQLRTCSGPNDLITRGRLRDDIQKLFSIEAEVVLFYFSGHGYIEDTGGYLLPSEADRGDEGVSMHDVLTWANRSPARNRIIVLDCCHAGIAGSSSLDEKLASLREGLIILAASTEDQYALEKNDGGVFSNLLVDALSGSAASLTGDIAPGSVYAHIDQSLGLWDQRPVFKANVRRFVSLRRVNPPISASDLHRITEFFPAPGHKFELDPSYEPELKGRDPDMPDPIPEHAEKFKVLQQYNRLNLVVPDGVQNMWNAAMQSTSCSLTPLGEHYRMLVDNNRI